PAKADACVEAQPGEDAPLRAAPGTVAAAAAAEHQLRNVRRQNAKQFFAFTEQPFGLVLIRAVAEDLDEPMRRGGERHHQSRGPEALSVFAHLPALVLGAAGRQRNSPLLFCSIRPALLGRERRIDGVADDLLFLMAEKAFGPDIPAGHNP